MAKMTAKKKKLFTGVAILVAIGLGYRFGTPSVRFRRDAKDKKTSWGAEVAASLASNPNQDVDSIVNYHIANTTGQFSAYVSKGWALKQ